MANFSEGQKLAVSTRKRKSNDNEDFQNDDRPMCLYGSYCYRRSPAHLEKYKHKQRQLSPPEANFPPCRNGAKCLERNLMHFALFYHPTANSHEKQTVLKEEKRVGFLDDNIKRMSRVLLEQEKSREKDFIVERKGHEVSESCVSTRQTFKSGERVEHESSEVAVQKKSKLNGDSEHDSILQRGPSILRSYSILTEDQRKDLIRRAFEVKQVLMKRLDDTEEILKDRTKELEAMRTKLDRNSLMVDGEHEAMLKNRLVYFPLFPQRSYQEDSASQIHFRLAESQFYRLLPAGSVYKVTRVEYVVQPSLVNRFKKARRKLKESRGDELSLPVLGFHGTKEKNIESICEEGFRVPGEQDFRHATDPGWYGKGVYFSEYPKYSMSYIAGSSKLLLCQVLPGKVFRCKHIIQGDSLRQGHDSHMSPDGKEVVIFNSHHILPSYIVHYAEVNGDFQYEQNE